MRRVRGREPAHAECDGRAAQDLRLVALVGEGLDFSVPKGYIYFAMAFSVGVEIVNLRVREKNLAARKLPPTDDSSGV